MRLMRYEEWRKMMRSYLIEAQARNWDSESASEKRHWANVQSGLWGDILYVENSSPRVNRLTDLYSGNF